MKKHNLILITALILVSLLSASCSVKTETSESYTDADGNTTTTTTKSDNGDVSTETTTSSAEDSEEEESEAADEPDADEPEEGDSSENSQNSDATDDVSAFVKVLKTTFENEGVTTLTLNEPQDMGDGKYTITTNSEAIEFTVQTDGSHAQSYTVAVIGDDAGLIMGNFSLLIIALLDGDEEKETGQAIMVRGESPVETEAYTFRAINGEIGEQSFSTLTAIVK